MEFGVWSSGKGLGAEVRGTGARVRLYLKSYGEEPDNLIFKLQNSYMTLGLYSFSEARHELKLKEHSEVQMGQSMSETIRARYRGTEQGRCRFDYNSIRISSPEPEYYVS